MLLYFHILPLNAHIPLSKNQSLLLSPSILSIFSQRQSVESLRVISQQVHDARRRAVRHQFPFHPIHVRRHVFKETAIAVAKKVQPLLPVRRSCEAVLRAFP